MVLYMGSKCNIHFKMLKKTVQRCCPNNYFKYRNQHSKLLRTDAIYSEFLQLNVEFQVDVIERNEPETSGGISFKIYSNHQDKNKGNVVIMHRNTCPTMRR